MNLYYHPLYSKLTLRVKHRFPIKKYQLLKNEIEQLGVTPFAFNLPVKATISQLQLCHHIDYINDFLTGNLPEKAIKKWVFLILLN